MRRRQLRAAQPTLQRYFVAGSGSDATGNGSAAAPWRTIQHAIDTAPQRTTIELLAGSYTEFTAHKIGQKIISATKSAEVVGSGAPALAGITITADDVELRGFTVRNFAPLTDPYYWTNNPIGSSCILVQPTSGVYLNDLVIRDAVGTNSQGLPIGCAGITAVDTKHLAIALCDISNMGYGIYLHGAGTEFVVINDNKIHDLGVIVRNTIGGDDDFGAIGIGFNNIQNDVGCIASNNEIWNCAGPSQDYGTDGGAFEIWNSSNITMTLNTLRNNENIFETGTALQWSGQECRNNNFTHNTCVGRTPGSTLAQSVGMIIRSAEDMVVTDNEITGVDWWAAVIGAADNFGGSTDRLRFERNTITLDYDKIYALVEDHTGKGWTIDNNTLKNRSGTIGTTVGEVPQTSLADWQNTTGFDRQSMFTLLP